MNTSKGNISKKEELSKDFNTKPEKKTESQSTEKEDSPVMKIIFIIALYVFGIATGLADEKVYKSKYITSKGKEFKVNRPEIILFIGNIFSTSIALLGYIIFKGKIKGEINSPISFFDKIIVGAYYVGSKFLADSALKYVDYLMKVIGKSCKSASIVIVIILFNLPIIGAIFKKLINFKPEGNSKMTIHLKDIIKVIITTASVLIFNFSPDSKKKPKDSKKSNDLSIFSGPALGLLLLVGSLLFDGLLAIKENVINAEAKNNPKYKGYDQILSWVYMLITSTCSLIFCFMNFIIGPISEMIKGKENISPIQKESSIIEDILDCRELQVMLFIYGLSGALMQSIIFLFLNKYGPLTLSMITSIRKVITIALSVVMFGKKITGLQFISLCLAVLVIFWEVLDKKKKSIKKE